jgi:hypothetical protein
MGVRLIGLFVPTALLASIAAGFAFHHVAERPLIAVFRALPNRVARIRPQPSPTR